MSYIQCVATSTQVVLTSDGRVSGPIEIRREDYKKIDRINKQVAVAYAGNKFLCELIIRDLKEKIKDNYESANVDIIYDTIMDICVKNLGKHPDDKVQLLIGGIRNNGKLGIKTISTNNDYDTKDYIPEENQISYVNATSDGAYTNVLEDKLNTLFSNKPTADITEIYKVMNDTSRYMASIDNSVNERIFREIIKL